DAAAEGALGGPGGVRVLRVPVACQRGKGDDVVFGHRAPRRLHRVPDSEIVEVRRGLAPVALARRRRFRCVLRLGGGGGGLRIHGWLLSLLLAPSTESAQIRRRRVSAGSTTSSTSPAAAATSAGRGCSAYSAARGSCSPRGASAARA